MKIGPRSPLPILGGLAGVPHLIVHIQTHEPTEQQVVLQLLHQQPLAAHPIEKLQQQRSQQLLRRDRRPPVARTQLGELRQHLFQRHIHQRS